MKNRQRLTHQSVGLYSSSSWISEGDGFLASAKITRATWQQHRGDFSEMVAEQKEGRRAVKDDWNKLVGLPRASMLLLGYSVEMYIKAALVEAFRGCPEDTFGYTVQSMYRHRLVKIAEEVSFDLIENDRNDLTLLKNMILFDARYPIKSEDGKTDHEEINKRTTRIWNEEAFSRYLRLAGRLRDHATAAKGERDNPVIITAFTVDGDGYVVIRTGGGLHSRMTYRLSRTQREQGETLVDDVIHLIPEVKISIHGFDWSTSKIYEELSVDQGGLQLERRECPIFCV